MREHSVIKGVCDFLCVRVRVRVCVWGGGWGTTLCWPGDSPVSEVYASDAHAPAIALCETEKEGSLCEVEAPPCWYIASHSADQPVTSTRCPR